MLKFVLVAVILMVLTVSDMGGVARLFYYPDRISYGTPDQSGLPYEEVSFASKDGTRLSGWFIPAVGAPRGTVIHFHGNAQNMSSHFNFVSWLPAEGFNLFVFDYRGYGRSAGKPDRRGVYEDSVAALNCIAARKDLDPGRLLVFGQSLGGANAITAVGANRFAGIRAVAVESAFSSYRGIVREKIGQIPVLSLLKWPLSYLLIGDDYSPENVVARISPVPLLLVYGTKDPIIPLDQGKRLYDKARQPKEFWSITGGHTEAFVDAGSPYRKRLVKFFIDALPGNVSAGAKGEDIR